MRTINKREAISLLDTIALIRFRNFWTLAVSPIVLNGRTED